MNLSVNRDTVILAKNYYYLQALTCSEGCTSASNLQLKGEYETVTEM